MSAEDVESLIAFCRENGRVCPMPDIWNMLPDRQKVGYAWEPPLPLILGMWYNATDLEKMVRLEKHIYWAEQHGCLDKVNSFLRQLAESDWYHSQD